MAGINLAQFATGAADIKPSEGDFKTADPGTYEYEITEIGVYKGEKAPSIYIDFRLDNGQTYREWHGLPAVYGQETDKERQAIARYLARLVSLGVPAETVSSFSDTDSLVGWRGVFDLVATKGKGANAAKTYINIRNLRQGARKTAAAAPAQAAPASAPAQVAQPASAPAAAAGDDDENPFGD